MNGKTKAPTPRALLVKLVDAVDEYSGDRMFGDEKSMERSADKVDKAVNAARRYINATAKPRKARAA